MISLSTLTILRSIRTKRRKLNGIQLNSFGQLSPPDLAIEEGKIGAELKLGGVVWDHKPNLP